MRKNADDLKIKKGGVVMKQQYSTPELLITLFFNADIITASGDWGENDFNDPFSGNGTTESFIGGAN